MANSNGWGDGAANNNIGWGQGAINNSISWGKSHISSWSGATDIDGGNAPTNTVAPAITGTAQEGQTLTCSTGTWTGTPTYTYQWKRNGSNIGSATNSTYTLVTADVGQSIKCTVTATNALGSSNADSNTVTPTSAFTGLLDSYPSASVAYSLRKLRSAYTGNVIRVRRSSDNTEQDFGFVNNLLDTASLLTFCGAGNGFITTWYDQSGNTNNSTQATATNQAQIVSSGSMITDPVSGKISSLWSSDSYALGSSITMTQTHFKLGVFNRTTTGTRIYGIGANAVTPKIGCWDANNSISSAYGTGTATHSASNTSTGKLIMTVLRDSSNNVKCWLNNTALTTGTSSGTANAISQFGAFSTVTTVGYKQEEVYWASDQESNRTGIETNANNYWTIY
jgi:hypothetical protein